MKALVIGHGVMGKAHARTLRQLCIEVATVDPLGDADYRSLDQAPDADVVCVATPPECLAPLAADSLRRGMKVLVEKPMAPSLELAQYLLTAELETEGVVHISYPERWNPAVATLKQALPLIGELRHVSIERLGQSPRCPDTGPALDLLTHDIDVLRFLDLWPRYLHATSSAQHVSAHFALTSGNATVQASHLHPSKRRTLTAVGADGMLTLDYQRQSLLHHTSIGSQEIEVDRREPLALQWQAFLAGEGVTSGEALANLNLALKAAAGSKGGVPSMGAATCTAQ